MFKTMRYIGSHVPPLRHKFVVMLLQLLSLSGTGSRERVLIATSTGTYALVEREYLKN